MNYRMYTDKDMNEMNMSMVEDISMEDDCEMPLCNGIHKHEIIATQDMNQMYGNMPMEDMDNMMPCCMMNQMGIMPYMVELEEDEEEEKCDDSVEDIVKKIEKHHPEIITILSAYGIPYPISSKIIKRIVHLTLKHK